MTEHSEPTSIQGNLEPITRSSLPEVMDFDALTLAEARTKKSPYERAAFFGEVYNQLLDKLVPPAPTAGERIEQAQNTLLEPSGLEAAYQKLFGRQMAQDLPDVSQQLKMAAEKHQGMVPQREISQVLDFGEKTASMEPDKPELT